MVGNKVSHIYSTLHPGFNYGSVISQLVLASHTGSLGSVAQGAWKLEDLPLGRCHFLSDPLRVWLYLLRKSAYRDFLHIILKHTQ